MSEMQTDVNKVTGLSTDAITALRKKSAAILSNPATLSTMKLARYTMP
jgi:hypothetical protein